MPEQAAHIAILFFSRRPEAEQIHKPYAQAGRRIHGALIRHAYQTAQKTQLPTYWIDEQKQEGRTFGGRLANAYQDLFGLGYEKVIAIGNDCPDLSTQDLLETSRLLESADWVAGPSLDGGVYLLGMRRSAFDRASFLKLPWQTSKLFQHLHQLIQNKGEELEVLAPKSDTDNWAELKVFLQEHGARHPLGFILFWIEIPSRPLFLFRRTVYHAPLYTSSYRRGPPFAEPFC